MQKAFRDFRETRSVVKMVSRCAMFAHAICFSFGVKHKVDVIAVLGAIQAVAKEELKLSDLWGAFLESPEDFSDPESHSLRLQYVPTTFRTRKAIR